MKQMSTQIIEDKKDIEIQQTQNQEANHQKNQVQVSVV
jgi:hypothetical protein